MSVFLGVNSSMSFWCPFHAKIPYKFACVCCVNGFTWFQLSWVPLFSSDSLWIWKKNTHKSCANTILTFKHQILCSFFFFIMSCSCTYIFILKNKYLYLACMQFRFYFQIRLPFFELFCFVYIYLCIICEVIPVYVRLNLQIFQCQVCFVFAWFAHMFP